MLSSSAFRKRRASLPNMLLKTIPESPEECSDPAAPRRGEFGSLSQWRSIMRFRPTPAKEGKYVIAHQYKVSHNFFFTVHRNEQHSREEIATNSHQFYFSTDIHDEGYLPFCDDFGPNDIADIIEFCKVVKSWRLHPKLRDRQIVYYAYDDSKHVTNATFLLGCYLMIVHKYSPEEAWQPFECIKESLKTFKDATFAEQTFHLSVLDCLRGVRKGMEAVWIHRKLDINKFKSLVSANMGDISQITDKFVAFRGPSYDPGFREPAHYVEIFKQFNMGVSAVVCLSSPSYDPEDFRKRGMRTHQLFFEDCTTPTDDLVKQFLDICEQEKGVIAVHCMAGLGRTGTMIALWIMRHHGWSALDCIGFLRVMRPGSVIGPQQEYLVECERRGFHGNSLRSKEYGTAQAAAESVTDAVARVEAGKNTVASSDLSKQVCAAVKRRVMDQMKFPKFDKCGKNNEVDEMLPTLCISG